MTRSAVRVILISSNHEIIQRFLEGSSDLRIDLEVTPVPPAGHPIGTDESIRLVFWDIDPFHFPDDEQIRHLRHVGESAVIAIVDSSLDQVLIKSGLFNRILVKPIDARDIASIIRSESQFAQQVNYQKIMSFYRQIFDSLQETVVIVDENCKIVRNNRSLLLMKGLGLDQISTQAYRDVLNETCHQAMFQRTTPCHMHGDQCPMIFLKKGYAHFQTTLHVQDRFYHAEMTRVDDHETGKQFFVETIRDITEQKQAEDALRFQMAFEEAIDQISSCMLKSNPDNLQVHCEAAFQSIANLIRAEHLYFIQPSEIFDQWFVLFEWLNPTCPPFYSHSKTSMTVLPDWPLVQETLFVRKETVFFQDIRSIPDASIPDYFHAHGIQSIALIPVKQQSGLHGIIGFESIGHAFAVSGNPVHLLRLLGEVVGNGLDRAYFEAALRRSEERYRRMTENAPDMILRFNVDGILDYVNPAVERILGHSRDSMIQTNVYDHVTSASREKLRKQLTTTSGVSYLWLEIDCVHSTGASFPCRMSLTIDRDESGKVVAVEAIVTDLHEYKQMEKEKEQLQARLFQSQKMEAIGNLAAGVAHEINNPIGVILGFSEYLLDSMNLSDPIRETLEMINTESIRIKDIVGKMMDFARMEKAEFKPVNLNRIVRESLKLMKHKLSQRHIRIWLDLEEPDSILSGHENALKQVLLNLIINAMEAIPAEAHGTISLSTKRRGDQKILLTISDSGVGISPEHMNLIFEPFHTTKEKGTGLGLPITASIIREHRGTIDVDSVPGKGTTFRIVLPAGSQVVPKHSGLPDRKGVST